MVHKDHVRLILKAIKPGKQVWADLGSGEGAFTLALRDVVGQEVEIFSIDKNAGSLRKQKEAFDQQFPGTNIHYISSDFTKHLDLPPLDGILAANSLHFVEDRVGILKQLKQYLKSKGKLLIVEYNVDHGNLWVPHPFFFETFKTICHESGFKPPELLATEPSRFLKAIYSAVSIKEN